MRASITNRMPTKAYAALDSESPVGPFSIERREPRANDVEIAIQYCGVCHSDLHQVRNEWGNAMYPIVPGHEIVGKVTRVGAAVKRFKVGDRAAVGCLVDSCRECASCKAGLEQYCEKGMIGTYNAYERDGKTVTYGGYSERIVTREEFVLSVSDRLDLARTAPLLCAGITTYSPLRHANVGKGQRVGVVGLGGLGHMGVKLARAFGAEVTVFTTSEKKRADAIALGAHEVTLSTDAKAMAAQAGRFDFILDTVSAPHDYDPLVNALRRDGRMTLVGAPPSPAKITGFGLIMQRRSVGGSLIGGIPETQEMLDFCAEHEIVSDVEVIPIQKINEAYERMVKGDVKYRFVIDLASLS
jgi:alcohol dehydrogenase (NADP+)